jgi:hypothetical protein
MAIASAPRYLQNVPRQSTMQAQDPSSAGLTDLVAHASHPSFLHLSLLVFEAVLGVICVCLPGYIAARRGMFDADAQKLVANLNVMLFTPCLSTLPHAPTEPR